MDNHHSEFSKFLLTFKKGIWLLGITAWLFGITDRSVVAFSDGYLSAIDIIQLFTACFFLITWLYLKPIQNINKDQQL